LYELCVVLYYEFGLKERENEKEKGREEDRGGTKTHDLHASNDNREPKLKSHPLFIITINEKETLFLTIFFVFC
jgi:hypothetical protein